MTCSIQTGTTRSRCELAVGPARFTLDILRSRLACLTSLLCLLNSKLTCSIGIWAGSICIWAGSICIWAYLCCIWLAHFCSFFYQSDLGLSCLSGIVGLLSLHLACSIPHLLCPTLCFALLSATSICQLAVGLLDQHLVVIPRFQLHAQFVHVLGMLSLQLDCAVWVCTLLSCIWLDQYAILLRFSWFAHLHSGLLIWHSACSFCTWSSQLVLYMYLLSVHLHSC